MTAEFWLAALWVSIAAFIAAAFALFWTVTHPHVEDFDREREQVRKALANSANTRVVP